MAGALLRSGKLQEFKALGEDGQPVFTSALQLREAIRLKLGREAAHCLAVPQRNEAGDHIDWYAPIEGDIVPWSSATDDERLAAKEQLVDMQAKLRNVGQSMKGEQGRERQIFGRLLEKVIYFPDDTHVYLVDGKPVLTFWGFIDPQGSIEDDPLGRLKARAPVAAPQVETPVAAPVTPVPSIPPPITPVATKKRFPWWWLLLIPLLLLLLFWLLRSCEPELPNIELPTSTPVAEEETPVDIEREGVDINGNGVSNISGTNIGGSSAVDSNESSSESNSESVTQSESGAEDAEAPTEPPADDTVQPPEEPLAETPPEQPKDETTPPEEEKPAAEQPTDEKQPEQPPAEPPQVPPGDKPLQPGADKNAGQDGIKPPDLGNAGGNGQPGAPQKPLEIPPNAAKNGAADFLNGQWKAGAGIQDARTGKPMQLSYDFKDGKGQVRMTGSGGVECVGDVGASMNNGALAIQNQGQVKCKDGSSYKLPEVQCVPGAGRAAKCTGTYENNQKFPMFIKQDER